MKQKMRNASVFIRWFDTDGGRCKCGAEVGSGPVGFSMGESRGPICDDCLADHHADLAHLLRLVNLLRGVVAHTEQDNPVASMVTLSTFVTDYHINTAWPHRGSSAVEFVKAIKELMERAPWRELLELAKPSSTTH